MVISSGNPPYQYSTDVPFRTSEDGVCCGISGLLIEEAQFVQTAEWRRIFGSFNNFPTTFYNYRPSASDPFTEERAHEPQVDGANLLNIPIQAIFIDYIETLRLGLSLLFDEYQSDLTFNATEMLEDWLRAAYPEHPEVGSVQQYFRSVPTIGDITDSDFTILGGSGTWFDLDWGEVMFNPYPWVAQTRFIDVHDRGGPSLGTDTFDIQMAPFFPAFQKTDGSLISLNGREPTTASQLQDYNIDPIGSGKVRLRGYVLRSETDYRLGVGSNPGFTFSTSNDFSFAAESARRVGSHTPAVSTAEVFLTPQAQSSGVYKILVRNRKENLPQTAVESGIISVWAPESQAYPVEHIFKVSTPQESEGLFYSNQLFNTGYHVFNDTLWITDVSDEGYEPSGLAVISPYTGHPLWVRFADMQLTSGSGVEEDPFGYNPVSVNWGDMTGMAKVGTSIYRMQPDMTSSSTSISRPRFIVTRFNSDLDFLEQIETDIITNAFIIPNALSLFLSGSDWYIITTAAGSTGTGPQFTKFSSDFQTFITQGNLFVIGAASISAGTVANGVSRASREINGIKRLTGYSQDGNATFTGRYDARGSGIWEFNIEDEGLVSQSGVLSNMKIIDLAPVIKESFLSPRCIIYDLIEVTGATHLPDGIWCLAAWAQASIVVNPGRLFLLQLEERVDANAPAFAVGFFDVKAAFDLGEMNMATTTNMNMIYQAID